MLVSIENNLYILLATDKFQFFFLQQRKTAQVNLQKDAISTQKQPSCKTKVQLYAKRPG